MLSISAEQGLYVAIGVFCACVLLFLITAGYGILIHSEKIQGSVALVFWFGFYIVAWVVSIVATLIFLKLALDFIAAPLINYLALTYLS